MDTTNKFSEELTKALTKFTDPIWLSEHSSLAAPYFLGEYLFRSPEYDPIDDKNRGMILRTLLRETANELISAEEGKYYLQLLEATFFDPQPIEAVRTEFGPSKASFYRNRDRAIQRLEEALIQRLRPSLRLESPIHTRSIVGREQDLDNCLDALRAGKTVGVAGPGGIGKTTVAARLSSTLNAPSSFWFTFRTELNDHLGNLIFALAYFLQSQGESSLWLQLVADKGIIDIKIVSGLLLNDLKKIYGPMPLLCFDEVDLLRPDESESHRQILSFLESIPDMIPVIFIGQRIPILTDAYVELTELSLAAIKQLLSDANILLTQDHIIHLKNYTRGNPRLLTLFIALHNIEDDLSEILSRVGESTSLEALLNRVLRRLTEQELHILMSLCVYRRPAPSDVWSDTYEQHAIQTLISRHLVQSDGKGSIDIIPIFRQTIYSNLRPEDREVLHLNAADVRSERGEYTSAAYHLVQGRHPEQAISLWYAHRRTEINQGQVEAALALFGDVSNNQVEGESLEFLALIKAELKNLTGNYVGARDELHKVNWQSPLLSSRASRLEGDSAEILGEMEIALNVYKEGLNIVEPLVEKILFRRDLAWVYKREYKLEDALQEANLAAFEVEYLLGEVMRDRCELDAAKTHYLAALELADETGNVIGEGKTRNLLAFVLAQQGKFEAAFMHWNKAHTCYRQVGKRSSLASVSVNQATGHYLAGDPDKAILLAQKALEQFREFEQPFGQAVAHTALAESYLALGQRDEALKHIEFAYRFEETSKAPDVLRIDAEIRLAQGDYEKAETLMYQAIDEAQRNEDIYLEAYARRALSKVFAKRELIEKVRAELTAAIDLFERLRLTWEADRTRQMFHEIT